MELGVALSVWLPRRERRNRGQLGTDFNSCGQVRVEIKKNGSEEDILHMHTEDLMKRFRVLCEEYMKGLSLVPWRSLSSSKS